MKSWKTPTPDDVKAATAHLARAEHYRYFFDRLQNPEWIAPLKKAGYFAHPPPKREQKEEGTVLFPPWPETEYLARMSKLESHGEVIFEVLMVVPESDNFRVYEDMISCALEMPGVHASKISKKVLRWIETSPSSSYLHAESLRRLITHLLKQNQIGSALNLAKATFRVIRESKFPLPDKSEYEWREAKASVVHWDYEESLNEIMRPLIDFAKMDGFSFLCELLRNAVIAAASDIQVESKEDSSVIWRRTIQDHHQNQRSSVRDSLVGIVRDAAVYAIESNQLDIDQVISKLRTYEWTIHNRISWFLVSMYLDRLEGTATEILLSRENFDDPNYRYEYASIAKGLFEKLSEEQRNKVLSWIEEGPDLENYRKSFGDQEVSAADLKRYKEHWQLRRLSFVSESLSGKTKEWFDQLTSVYGEPAHPEFSAYRSEVWHGPTSPLTEEELIRMEPIDLVKYLRSWNPPQEPMSPSEEGLGRLLTKVVSENAFRYLGIAYDLKDTRPVYIRAAIRGFSSAVDKLTNFQWDGILNLCRWVVETSDPVVIDTSANQNEIDEWSWTRQAIASLLGVGFNSENSSFAAEEKDVVRKIVESLTRDPNPTPAYEEEFGGSNMDPHTLSINTTRGEAFHALIKYAFWKRKSVSKVPIEESSFAEMPEVQKILDLHLLDDPSVAIRSVYGQWFPWLLNLDKTWSKENAGVIFGDKEPLSIQQLAAWETYLLYSQPFDDTFVVLKQQYLLATARLALLPRESKERLEVEEHLGQHIVTFYVRGKLHLDDKLIVEFFENAPPALRGRVVDYVGRVLRNEKDLPSDILTRLQKFWEWRVAKAKQLMSEDFHPEMKGFGWWFSSGCYEDEWLLQNLDDALSLVPETDMDDDVVEKLCESAESFPGVSLRCVEKIVLGDKKGWGIYGMRNKLARIIEIGMKSSDPEAQKSARNLVNVLGARGYHEFRDLLKLAP